MFKSAVLLLVWLCSATTICAQESGDAYLSMTTQIGVTRNRLIKGEPMQSNPTAFYHGFKFGFFVAPKVVLAFEYSAFIYRWSNRSIYYNFSESEWDSYKPTKGEKVNHYKLLVEFMLAKGLFISVGGGLMNYREFELGYRERGVGLYGSITQMLNKNIGVSANLYLCDYNRYPFSGYFKGLAVGLVFRMNSWED